MKPIVIMVGVVAVMVALAGAASAEILYSQDFEGATDGELMTALGFTEYAPGGKVRDTAEVGMAYDPRGDNTQHCPMIDLPKIGSQLYTVSADMYITGEADQNNSLDVWGNPGHYGQAWASVDYSYVNGGWTVYLWDVASHQFQIETLWPTTHVGNVAVSIVVDPSNQQMWGVVDGVASTKMALPAADFGMFSTLVLADDSRRGGGAIYDNLLVSQAPEPSTIALLATGLLGLAAYVWRKRK